MSSACDNRVRAWCKLGFRPFVWSLGPSTTRCRWVLNDEDGWRSIWRASEPALKAFGGLSQTNRPISGQYHGNRRSTAPSPGFEDFTISGQPARGRPRHAIAGLPVCDLPRKSCFDRSTPLSLSVHQLHQLWTASVRDFEPPYDGTTHHAHWRFG